MNPFDSAAALDILRDGELEVLGRLVASTNDAMYSRVTRICPDPEPPVVLDAVYKPIRGERPLDDFPDGTLARREVAAHAVSQATGWAIVPPTVMRDGPFGEGMVQLWIDVDESVDVVAMVVEDDLRLRRIALFDAVVNNTDRKGGHLLPVPGGHVFGVDHGVCFSTVPKLRTVLWGWRGEAIEPDEVAVLERLREDLDGGLGEELRELLLPVEVAATIRRTDRLLATRRFPWPSPGWPAVPWPPF
ncbi:MAG TPA: SCO1664 family protein [Candidatus Limnocylindrales bacterium]|nr:SCO1664 family protein [Candidatus Limnocylindrales bacterium]